MTYIAFETKEQRQRYEQECQRLGYPVDDWWESGAADGHWDPGVPSEMPEHLAARAHQFALMGFQPSDLHQQHPEFKYLRVPLQQG